MRIRKKKKKVKMNGKELNLIAQSALEIAAKKGFAPRKDIDDIEKEKWYLGTKIALIHSEASEMLEALRDNDRKNLIVEGIDVIIRTLEFLACLKDVDIDFQLRKKMMKNDLREWMHGDHIF